MVGGRQCDLAGGRLRPGGARVTGLRRCPVPARALRRDGATLEPSDAGLLRRPWQAYNSLVLAHQYGVIDKLLFGSDFPYTNATECIETLYSINQLAQGTNLPVVPREALRGIVERDTLALLGLG